MVKITIYLSDVRRISSTAFVKKQVNKASKAVKLAKRNFEKQIAKKIKSDPKSFYSYVKSKTKFKSTIGPLSNDNGDLVGDYREMAELLNTFLHLCLLQKIPITYQILITFLLMWTIRNSLTERSLYNRFLITPELVHSKLSKLKMNKSPGIDFVYYRKYQ